MFKENFLSDKDPYFFNFLLFNFVNFTAPVPMKDDSKYKFSWFELNICNPLKNQEIEAVVEAKNKMGIKAVVQPLYIIIAKQHH